MNSILERVNQYLGDIPSKKLDDSIMLTIVETLDDMGIILSKEQQKTLLLNINKKTGDVQ